jgi:hypothetical protein
MSAVGNESVVLRDPADTCTPATVHTALRTPLPLFVSVQDIFPTLNVFVDSGGVGMTVTITWLVTDALLFRAVSV